MKTSVWLLTAFLLFSINLFAQDEDWEDQTVPFEFGAINKLSFSDENHGWALGTDDGQGNVRVVLQTTDGGTNWNIVDLSAFVIDPISLHAIDENTCTVVGINDDNGSAGFLNIMVIQTTDKGESWSVQNAPETQGLLLDVTFTSSTHGIAVGTNFTNQRMLIIYTTDGLSWQQATYPEEDYQLEKVTFSDAEHGWAIGSPSSGEGIPGMFKTANGGVNWSKVDHPIVDGNFNDISFIDENTGWAPGIKNVNDEDVGFLIHTKDGGTSWTDVELDIAADGELNKVSNRSGLSLLTFYLYPELINERYWGVFSAYEKVDNENDYSIVSLLRFYDDVYDIIEPIIFENHTLWAYQVYYTNESGKTRNETYLKGSKKDEENNKPVIQKKKTGILVKFYEYFGKNRLVIEIKDNSNLKVSKSTDGYVTINDEPAVDQQGNKIKADEVNELLVLDEEETGIGNNKIDISDVTKNNYPNIGEPFIDGSGDWGYGSIDVICGQGDEEVICSPIGTFVEGNAGDDELHGKEGHDNLKGGSGDDFISGGRGEIRDYLDGGPNDDIIVYNDLDRTYGGYGNDEYIKFYETNKSSNKVTIDKLFTESKVDSLVDEAGNDTLNYSQDSTRLFIDLDLTDDYQVIDEEGNRLYLVGQFENLIGSPFDDVIFVDPLDVQRLIDGGGSTDGDTLYVDAKGETPDDDGMTIAVPGYVPITYVNISEVIYENTSPVDDEENPLLPEELSLMQNYPNPFNPSTTIEYAIPERAGMTAVKVTLIVYDLLGSEIAVLVNERKRPGIHEVKFDAKDLNSGVYLYELKAEDTVCTKKMVIFK